MEIRWIPRRSGCICGCVWSFCEDPAKKPYNDAVFPLSIRIARPFFVYSGAESAPLVFCPDPNRDPNAKKSVGIIRAGKNDVVEIPEWKGAEML